MMRLMKICSIVLMVMYDDVDMDVYDIVIVIDGYGKDQDIDSDDYCYDHDA